MCGCRQEVHPKKKKQKKYAETLGRGMHFDQSVMDSKREKASKYINHAFRKSGFICSVTMATDNKSIKTKTNIERDYTNDLTSYRIDIFQLSLFINQNLSRLLLNGYLISFSI